MPCRTDITETYERFKQGKETNYVDVISLYLYICKYGKFPVVHLKFYVGRDTPLVCLVREGIIQCKFYLPGNCTIQYVRIRPNTN